ncbi:MAG: amino acid transporter, partial [Bacteroidaceae bacterium]|nr:amino acid transporter [Bacteroidaceae bacterium]
LMWLIAGIGFLGSLLAFVLSFIPPGQIAVGSSVVWYAVLVIGCIVVVAAPIIIYALRKPSWSDPSAAFEPFHWEENTTPATDKNESASGEHS